MYHTIAYGGTIPPYHTVHTYHSVSGETIQASSVHTLPLGEQSVYIMVTIPLRVFDHGDGFLGDKV